MFLIEQFGFAEHQQARTLQQSIAIGLELTEQHLGIGDRVGAAAIHQVDQHPGALDVAQEIMAESGSLGGTSNQSGDISKDRAIAAGAAHHPQVGNKRGEGIVGDLGAGG